MLNCLKQKKGGTKVAFIGMLMESFYHLPFKVKSAALDCCRLLSREKNGLNEAVTQVDILILMLA